MRIGKPELLKHPGEVIIRSPVEWGQKKDFLWFSFDPGFEKYLADEKLDGFLVGLLPVAMSLGEDIELDGAVSERLYYNLSNHAMPILSSTLPGWRQVGIHPAGLDTGKSYLCEGAVGTGFSGGIDSFSTLVTHLGKDTPASYRITHLVFNNVGSHGERDTATTRRLFHARYALTRGMTDETGLESVRMDSNLHGFFSHDFVHSHPLRNASTALILYKLFGKYIYSSGYHYHDCFIGPTTNIATTDPAVIPLLSTETLEFISTGFQFSRVEKTRQTTTFKQSRDYLNVCVNPDPAGGNCSVCEKCARTLLTLELLGCAEEYKNVFQLDKYRLLRPAFVAFLLARQADDPYSREIVEYARRIGHRFPLACHAAAIPVRFLPARVTTRAFRLLHLVWPAGRVADGTGV